MLGVPKNSTMDRVYMFDLCEEFLMKKQGFGLLIAALTLIASPVFAQTPVPALQDLVGARGSSGEMELQKRGYQFLRTEKSGSDAYSYWKEKKSGKCVTVHTAEGRYQSLVYAPSSDCQTAPSSSSGGKTPENLISTVPPALKDLVNAKAGQASSELARRGYTYRNTQTWDGGKTSYYIENKTGYCVEVGTVEGRFSTIVYNSSDRCQKSD